MKASRMLSLPLRQTTAGSRLDRLETDRTLSASLFGGSAIAGVADRGAAGTND